DALRGSGRKSAGSLRGVDPALRRAEKMLPLSIKDDEYKPPKFNLFGKISGWFRSILSDKTSRNLFFFLCLNLSFAFVELLYGIWSNW
ncbi:hypothetical protein EI555_000241, partial [Monodon monoceros]